MDTLAGSQVSFDTSTNRFLKVLDVAKLMGVPVSTVYDLARQKRIGGMVRFGRHIRFDRSEFERWLNEGGEKDLG